MLILFWLHQVCFAESTVSEDRAKELFFNGQLLYEEQEYDSAVLAWKKGYEITQLPAFLKNIALAYEANKEYPQAIDFLKQYRAFAPFEEQEELKTWLTELEKLQAEALAAEEALTVIKAAESTNVQTDDNTAERNNPSNTLNPNTTPIVESIPKEVSNKQFTPRFFASLGSTVLLAGGATAMTIQSSTLYTEIENACELNSGFCLDSVSDTDLLSQFNRSKSISLALWGTTLVGAGLSTWQYSQSVQVSIQHGSLTIGGQF